VEGGAARRRFPLKLLLDDRLDNPVAYAVQVGVSRKEINLKREELAWVDCWRQWKDKRVDKSKQAPL
jgi:hypothetical protein